MATNSIIVSMEYERDTKNKVRFREVDTNHIGKLYLLQEDHQELGGLKTIEVEVRRPK